MTKVATILFSLIVIGCATMNLKNSIEIGMSKEEVRTIRSDFIEELIMTSGGQFSKGLKFINDEKEFHIVFDENEIVYKIITSSPSFYLNSGISVNSTFGEVKKTYDKYSIELYSGYGRLVSIENENITLGFSWSKNDQNNKTINDSEKVKWIEVNRITVN